MELGERIEVSYRLNLTLPRADITHPIARICTYLWQSRLVSNYHSQRSLKKSS